MGTARPGRSEPRISIAILRTGFREGGRNVGHGNRGGAVGVKAPLVTSPIAFPLVSATFMCVRAAARPSSLRPTRMRPGPSESSRRMRSAPEIRPPPACVFRWKRQASPRPAKWFHPCPDRKEEGPPQAEAYRARQDRSGGLPARPEGGGRSFRQSPLARNFEAVFAGVARARNLDRFEIRAAVRCARTFMGKQHGEIAFR